MRSVTVGIILTIVGLTLISMVHPFTLLLYAMASMLWIGVPLALLSLLILLYRRLRGKEAKGVVWILQGLCLYAGFAGFALGADYLVQRWAMENAKAYPAAISPALEAYRHEHGAYPESLERLAHLPEPPRLLRARGYRTDGRTYYFDFIDPWGFLDFWGYDSETRTWRRYS